MKNAMVLLLLGLVLAGCGSGGTAPTTAAPAAGSARLAAREGHEQQLMLNLKAGWNAVGFQCVELRSITPNPALAGLVWWDGKDYQSGAVTLADVCQAGLRHGFWVYASEATVLSYSGVGWSGEERLGMRLESGWNLVTFPMTPHDLRCYDGLTEVAADAMVLDRLQPADHGGAPVELKNAMAGIPYWLYSSRAAVLGYSPVAPASSPEPSPAQVAPSPSPSPSPETAASPLGQASPSPSSSPSTSGTGASIPNGESLAFETQPASIEVGAPFDVEVRSSQQGSITLDISEGPPGSSLSGTLTAVTDANGIAHFTGLSLSDVGIVKLAAHAGTWSVDSQVIEVTVP